MTPNRAAFLDAIGVSEGTSTSHITRNHGYDVIVGLPEVFTDYRDHPFTHRAPKIINAHLSSTAAGKYQIMLHDWPHYKAQLSLPDFSPASQDLLAIQLIRERGALPLIDGGSFDMAVTRCANLWASFPDSPYGQHENSMSTLRNAYLSAGGQLMADGWGNEVRR